MTDQLPLPSGLSAGESLESGSSDNANEVADVTNDLIDLFADITIIDSNCDASNASINQNASVEATHIIVLIHGWMGNPAEMGYIRTTANTEDTSVNHRFIIHSAACNCDRTDDGVAVGGARIAHEINHLVRHVVKTQLEGETANNGNASQKFTLSIVGNSLGGLYARHALAGIEWDIGGSESSSPPVMLIPMSFVTTATPHLGISQHTYVPLPRAAEFVVAQGMKETGRDFFRFTQVLEDLFCKDYFLDPLSSFQQRIAYINVYGTDFQVPTATAAFWAADSDSPHYRIKEPSEDTNGDPDSSSTTASSTPKSIVMMLTTPRCPEQSTQVVDMIGEEKKGEEGDERVEETEKNSKADSEDVFTSWSKRLDKLGWTKVLVDVREDVPDVRKVRQSIATVIDGSSSDGSEDEANDNGSKASDSNPKNEDETNDKIKNEDEDSNDEIKSENAESKDEDSKSTEKKQDDDNAEEENDASEIPDWTTKDTWTAGELLAEFKGGLLAASNSKEKRRGSLWDLKPRLPLGHTVMIANAKDAFNKKVTSGGKPVMDYLGASLVRTLQESVPSRNDTGVELHEC
eukprot:CAMPEP_0116150270 /NCGR_PEP_ID=MMETSP0329-20121206/19450_1 /TAXON_ID=697910 /ORGANISM="Pseudo-nitzschia arenysensis, Strain B593" /LENGTH=575 /DNA_ID=CAMNT_0003646757 /DNA_START=156 /DNA_END=1883 /DNA_ORIENTATION=+